MSLYLLSFLTLVLATHGGKNNATSKSVNNFEPLRVILRKCPVSNRVNWPMENEDDKTVTTYLTLSLDRFVEVDDVSETFTIIGGIYISWLIPCVEQLYNSIDWIDKGAMLIHNAPYDAFWRPDFMHRNSFVDSLTIGGESSNKRLAINVTRGQFTFAHYGRYTSYCNLKFAAFPFDKQECKIVIGAWNWNSMYLNVTNSSVSENTNPSAIPFNSAWMLLNMEHNAIMDGYMAQIEFSFNFQRKASYFGINLFAPGLILSVLQLTSFLLPPDAPDRSAYTVTIMLTLFVLKTEIMSYLPKTPRPIYLSYYTLGEIVYSTACTTYSALICWICQISPSLLHGKRSVISTIEMLAFTTACISLILINFITAWSVGLFEESD